jgi:hypothetical protein
MGFGSKIGRALLKASKQAEEIDEGLNDLLGENRTKPGDGFSQDKTAKRTEGIVKGNRNKDKLSLSSGKSRDKRIF